MEIQRKYILVAVLVTILGLLTVSLAFAGDAYQGIEANNNGAGGGAPDIEVDPGSLEETLAPDMMSTQPLTISNIGVSNLDWTVEEEAPRPLPAYVAGLYTPSALAAPPDGVGVTTSPAGTPNAFLGSMVRSWNSQNGPYFTIFDLDTPGTLPNIAAFPGNGQFIGAGEFVNGLSYMADTANTIFVVDDTGTLQNSYAATAPPGGQTYSGFALDQTDGTVYASSTNVAASTLLTIDVTNGSAVVVGAISGSAGTIAIAVDGAGNLFGYDIVSNTFFQINKATGTTSNSVALPFDANFGQGMGYDPATGLLYMLAFNNGTFQAELWTVDTSTPASPVFNFIGVLGSTVPGGLNQLAWGGTDLGPGGCSPSDIPWLSVNPTNGTTAPGNSDVVDVTFDATGLSNGVYNGDLCIASNDPVDPSVRVPVTLTVASVPSIAISKSPATQAVTTNGTAVFTITVTNTGDLDLANVNVSDPLVPDCDNAIGALTISQTVSYACQDVGVTGSYTNVVTVTSQLDTGAPGPSATASAEVIYSSPTGVSLSGFEGNSTALTPIWVIAILVVAVGFGLILRRKLIA